MSDEIDLECLRRLAAGDKTAAAELYDRHAAAMYSLALRLVVDESLAADVVRDAFLEVFRHAARYDSSRGSVAAWLLLITLRRAISGLSEEQVVERLGEPLATVETRIRKGLFNVRGPERGTR